MSSSWRKKMRVKWNRNLDGSSSSGCEEPGPLERRGSLRKPTPPPSAKDEPFKKSWSFRLGTSKDKEPGDKSVFLRMFRFGKDKKRVQQEVSSRRRMSDAGGSAQGQVLKEELTQWSSVPVELSESPEIRRRQDLVLMRAHTLPRSLEAGLVGDGGAPDDTDANVWGVIYCDPRPQLHKDKLPRVTLETSTNREAEERAKVFSSAVLPHFTHSAGEVKGLDEDKRGLKRLLLNGHPSNVQCAAPSSQDDAVFAQGQDRVSPPGSLSGHCIEVPAKMDPSPDGDNRHVDMAAGGCPTDVDALAVLEDDVSSHLPTGTVDCPSSSSTFVVELNHGYRDESDDSQRPEPSEDSDADRLLPAFASVSHGAILENGNVEGCFEDSCVVDIEAPSDEHWEDEFGVTENSHGTYDATMELSQLLDTCRQNRGSVSTSSSCEECTAQDEFEFVPADPPVIQLQRTSRDIECCDIECSVSDVFESYPLREKASFIFFEEDCVEQPSGSSLLSTPDDGPAGDPFVLVDGDEEVSVQGICSDSELDPVDLGDSGEQEEREVRIVDQLREVTTPDDPRGCNAVIDTHLEVTERPVPVTSDLPASSTEERPQDDMLPEATGEGIQNDGSPREMEMSTETRGDVLFVVEFRSGQSDGTKLDAAQLDGHREIEAEETSRSLKDRIHFFNSISQESTPEPPLPIARHTRVSKIPTPSRLPRLSSRPAKDSSPLAPAPVPAKRTRLGGRPAHIPLPCRIRRHPGSLQANSGTHSDPNINLHVADDATAKGPKCKSSTPSVLPEGLSQLKRSGTFVLEDSDPPPQPAPSQGPPRVTVAGVRPFEYKDKNVECDANVAQEPTARTDPCVSITEQQTPASFSIFSVQVPVVDSTDPTEHPEKTPDVCACGQSKKGTLKDACRGAAARPKPGGEQVQTKAEFTKEIQRLGALCESRTKELNLLKLQLRHASAGFTSLAVVIQHINAQHDAFFIPNLSEELRKSREEIDRARVAIEEYKVNIEEMKQVQESQIAAIKADLAAEHASRMEKLEALHKNDLACYLESHTRKVEELKALYTSIIEDDRKSHLETMDALKQRHREKIDAINEEYSLQLDSINEDHKERQAELDSRHAELLVQYKALQEQAKEFQDTVLQDTDTKIQWLSKKNADLQKEVESLNVVLEMRADQIQNLQRSKLDMERKEEELERCKAKMEKMEARIEDLQELLNEKVKLQSQLSVENAKLRETSEKQNRQLSRLDMHNEELQYKLRESSNSSYSCEGNSASRSRNSPQKRFSVADPTAMSQSWHADRSRTNTGRQLTSSMTRVHQRSQTLPRSPIDDFLPEGRKMRRSMSETSPPDDRELCLQLFQDSTTKADEELSYRSPKCSQEDVLRLTWVKEDVDLHNGGMEQEGNSLGTGSS